jgi:tripartite-type tricarboxylate transporter receptor subunit TctC
MTRALAVALSLTSLLASVSAHAAYPERVVRVIVPAST